MAHLRQLSDTYKDEIIDPAQSTADRKGLLGGLEVKLKNYMAKMDTLKPGTQHFPDGTSVTPPRIGPVVSPEISGPGSVKELVKFHSQQIKSVGAIDKQGELVVQVRQWLFRQGATLSPNGSIIWNKSEAELKYDSELEQQAMTKITVRNGLLYNADDTPLDTKKLVTARRGPGWCIYVMSAENNIHVSSHAVGGRHHSSLLAGGDVACAGEMKVHDGHLIILSNKSGHYCPPPVYLTQVIRVLTAADVDEESYAVNEHLPPDGRKVVSHAKARLFMDTQRCPVWPSDDIDDTPFVPNPNFASSYFEANYARNEPGGTSDLFYGAAY